MGDSQILFLTMGLLWDGCRESIMNFHDQHRPYRRRTIYWHIADYDFYQTRSGRVCHPERSEGSLCPSSQILRFAQDDSVRSLRLMPIGWAFRSPAAPPLCPFPPDHGGVSVTVGQQSRFSFGMHWTTHIEHGGLFCRICRRRF